MNRDWRSSLTRQMAYASNIVCSSDLAVVLEEKYRKAQLHYLVLPKDDIKDIYQLTHAHLELLEDMQQLAHKVILSHQMQPNEFLIGFRRNAQMRRLNMHVVSKDFISMHLTKHTHWTDFHTGIFLPYNFAYVTLKVIGIIERLPAKELKMLRCAPLSCNQCPNYRTHAFSKLKEHLRAHWQQHLKANNEPKPAVTACAQQPKTYSLAELLKYNEDKQITAGTTNVPALLDVKIDQHIVDELNTKRKRKAH